ncbi:MAG: type VII secretion-associated protein [Pseudonocardiaceae bacterium]
MSLWVAVDFGTSSTCVVASLHGREPQVVVIDGSPLLPSAVYAAPDGTLFVGNEAERQAAVDPSRYEPHPKRRIDEGELLLGDRVLPVRDVAHAVLRRAVVEARRFAGGADIGLLVLTHPADWGVVRSRVLRQAAGGLAREVTLVPEPVAAAVFHAATFAAAGASGGALAVLDLGGGTVDVSVVRREPGQPGRRGFRVLATRGDPSFGGVDIDQALLEHVGSLVSGCDPQAWRDLMEGRELADRRRRRVLRQDVRGAKETLSRHSYTDVPLPPPFSDAHVTRENLDRLIAAPLGRAVDLTAATIAEAGLNPRLLAGIFLVGGASRIPMMSRLIHERVGVVPTTLDQPETVVARGALRAVSVERPPVAPPPVRPGPVPPAEQPLVRAGLPPAGQGRFGAATVGEPVESRGKLGWILGATLVLVVAIGAGVAALLGDTEPEGHRLAQYDYGFIRPPDWAHTGGVVEQRKVVVRPQDARRGENLVVVQEFPLAFDATADRSRLVRELRNRIQQAGPAFADLDPEASYGDRPVIRYLQRGKGTTVEWYVLARKRVQISVGCQYTASGVERVRLACEQIVRTLQIAG